ncbi:MAG: endonuclease III [Clostridia bacterium]|nr:endonuclease III [Clostridia bacterium]
MTRAERALAIVEALKKAYPAAACTLSYDEAWKLLVSVRLAAQCTDARVNTVTEILFAEYPSVDALAAADPADIEAIVRPCGLGPSKARDISACMRVLRDRHGGHVPDTMEALLALPGVGRKSANLILGDIFGKPAIVCDTHCIRLCGRMGLTTSRDPVKTERELRPLIPPEESNDFCHRLVEHGRAVCSARTRPACERCCAAPWCEKNGL